MLRSEQYHQLVAGAADVARTNGQDCVARPRFFEQLFDALLHGREVENVFMAGIANRLGERLACYARDGLLAGGVNVGQDEDVGLVEGTAEIVPERLRPRITMRLKENQR